MIRRPPRSTRTDTLFPYTTLFRSQLAEDLGCSAMTPYRYFRDKDAIVAAVRTAALDSRSEEHTSELQSLMRISYAVFCLKTKKRQREKGTDATKSTQQTDFRNPTLITQAHTRLFD